MRFSLFLLLTLSLSLSCTNEKMDTSIIDKSLNFSFEQIKDGKPFKWYQTSKGKVLIDSTDTKSGKYSIQIYSRTLNRGFFNCPY